jgi:hypothetical protein
VDAESCPDSEALRGGNAHAGRREITGACGAKGYAGDGAVGAGAVGRFSAKRKLVLTAGIFTLNVKKLLNNF